MKKLKQLVLVVAIVSLMLVSFGAQASGEIDITEDIFTGTVTVQANFENCKSEPVSVQLVPLDTDIDGMAEDHSYALTEMVYFNQTNSDSSGNVIFTFPLKADTGKYIVRMHSMTHPDSASEKLFVYTSYTDALEFWNGVIDSPAQNLTALIDILNIDDELIDGMKDDSDLHSIIESYEDIGEFTKENADKLFMQIRKDCEELTLLREALSEIRLCENVSQVSTIIKNESYAEVLGISDYVERYFSLKTTRIVDKALAGKEFEDAKDFSDIFVEALKKAEDDEEENEKGGSSSSSSKGGSGSLGTSVNVAPVYTNPEVVLPFNDLTSVPWANEAVASLYSKGIISGKSETAFAPGDYILREEFVKMIAVYLGLEISDTETSFDDVDKNAWYAPYVAASVKSGFISGYSDSSFGTGDYITRQDVAVILSRIAKLPSDAAAITFTDDGEIASYAKDAVKALASKGVINGSNGAFMPNSYSTRAETAVMIYRLDKSIKEGM